MEVDQYFPPVAGALCYLLKLKGRTDTPMDCLKLIDHPLLLTQSAKDIATKYEELQVTYFLFANKNVHIDIDSYICKKNLFQALIEKSEQEIFTEWAEKLPEICSTNLSKTLLTVHEDRSLELNFSPELTAILRETRYMTIMKRTDLPQEAIDLFARTQFFFESVHNLNLIINWSVTSARRKRLVLPFL